MCCELVGKTGDLACEIDRAQPHQWFRQPDRLSAEVIGQIVQAGGGEVELIHFTVQVSVLGMGDVAKGHLTDKQHLFTETQRDLLQVEIVHFSFCFCRELKRVGEVPEGGNECG